MIESYRTYSLLLFLPLLGLNTKSKFGLEMFSAILCLIKIGSVHTV